MSLFPPTLPLFIYLSHVTHLLFTNWSIQYASHKQYPHGIANTPINFIWFPRPSLDQSNDSFSCRGRNDVLSNQFQWKSIAYLSFLPHVISAVPSLFSGNVSEYASFPPLIKGKLFERISINFSYYVTTSKAFLLARQLTMYIHVHLWISLVGMFLHIYHKLLISAIVL